MTNSPLSEYRRMVLEQALKGGAERYAALNDNTRCYRCALPKYEHRDHNHRRVGCPFGDCGAFV